MNVMTGVHTCYVCLRGSKRAAIIRDLWHVPLRFFICVCVREKERARERERERESERESERERECVCITFNTHTYLICMYTSCILY